MDDLKSNSSPASGLPLAFHGTAIHSRSLTELEVLENCFILVDKTGKIQTLQANVQPEQINTIISDHGYAPDVFPIKHLQRGQFICPGFIDTHNHAPQWAQRGLGIRGESLLDWLNKVTFAHEAKFQNAEYARQMYASCVSGFLQQGITTASYYGSHHGTATQILAETCLEKGQRALVGKCNMNRNAPEWYRDESVASSLTETRDLIQHITTLDPTNLITPILTPRFAISCTPDLLTGLGDIAKENPHIPIQTHFNEASQEIAYTRQLFPKFHTEAQLYKEHGLLNNRTILAHCIFLEEEEISTLRDLDCGVSHCPISNTTMQEFMVAPIREYLRRGIKVGLGTDSGGGYSSSMLDAMKQAFIVSNARNMLTKGTDEPLSLAEGFYLATLGGARVCGLEKQVGNFEIGKEFDALEIHTGELDGSGLGLGLGVMSPVEEEDSILDVFEKFLMTGDDRNIVKVYVRGRSVKV